MPGVHMGPQHCGTPKLRPNGLFCEYDGAGPGMYCTRVTRTGSYRNKREWVTGATYVVVGARAQSTLQCVSPRKQLQLHYCTV